MEEFASEYKGSLQDLTFNSKPVINTLTILADENKKYASEVVRLIEERIKEAQQSMKLPCLYLLDSIVKNLGGNYPILFENNLVETFVAVFQLADEKARKDMYKLRQTWKMYFPAEILRALDVKTKEVDPNWPILKAPTSKGGPGASSKLSANKSTNSGSSSSGLAGGAKAARVNQSPATVGVSTSALSTSSATTVGSSSSSSSSSTSNVSSTVTATTTPVQSSSIHINPRFLPSALDAGSSAPALPTADRNLQILQMKRAERRLLDSQGSATSGLTSNDPRLGRQQEHSQLIQDQQTTAAGGGSSVTQLPRDPRAGPQAPATLPVAHAQSAAEQPPSQQQQQPGGTHVLSGSEVVPVEAAMMLGQAVSQATRVIPADGGHITQSSIGTDLSAQSSMPPAVKDHLMESFGPGPGPDPAPHNAFPGGNGPPGPMGQPPPGPAHMHMDGHPPNHMHADGGQPRPIHPDDHMPHHMHQGNAPPHPMHPDDHPPHHMHQGNLPPHPMHPDDHPPHHMHQGNPPPHPMHPDDHPPHHMHQGNPPPHPMHPDDHPPHMRQGPNLPPQQQQQQSHPYQSGPPPHQPPPSDCYPNNMQHPPPQSLDQPPQQQQQSDYGMHGSDTRHYSRQMPPPEHHMPPPNMGDSHNRNHSDFCPPDEPQRGGMAAYPTHPGFDYGFTNFPERPPRNNRGRYPGKRDSWGRKKKKGRYNPYGSAERGPDGAGLPGQHRNDNRQSDQRIAAGGGNGGQANQGIQPTALSIQHLLATLAQSARTNTGNSTSNAPAAGGSGDADASLPKQVQPNVVQLPVIKIDDGEQLKRVYPAALELLYTGSQCSNCGQRFTQERSEEYQRHLDWHFHRKQLLKENKAASRPWLVPLDDWVTFVEGNSLEPKGRSVVFEDASDDDSDVDDMKMISCPVGGNKDAVCAVCCEPLKPLEFWHDEEGEWHYRDTVFDGGKLYHQRCFEDSGPIPDTPTPDERKMEIVADPLYGMPVQATDLDSSAADLGLSTMPDSDS